MRFSPFICFALLGACAVEQEVRAHSREPVRLGDSERFETRQRVSDLTIELRHLEPTPMAGAQTEGYVATLLVGQSQ
jgi:hypothetical protein